MKAYLDGVLGTCFELGNSDLSTFLSDPEYLADFQAYIEKNIITQIILGIGFC
jgi:hypothetical protein